MDVRQVLLDQELLDRVVRSIQLEQGGSYAAALEVLHTGAEALSLEGALERAQLDSGFIEAALDVLDALDAAARRAHERTARRIARERVDGIGRVRLEESPEAAMDPEQREHRLARARSAAPGQFEGDHGRERFIALDRQHLCAGLDMVRTLERPRDIRTLRSKPAALAGRLVMEIAAEGAAWQKLELLEARVAELSGGVVDLEHARSAGTRQSGRRAAARATRPRRAHADTWAA